MRRRAGFAVVVAVLLAFCVSRAAVGAEEFQAWTHRGWMSSVLVEDSHAVARMCTATDDAMLALDMEPDEKGVGWSIFMMGEASDAMKVWMEHRTEVSFFGQMRVDRGEIYGVKFDFYLQGDALIIEMRGKFRNKFLSEAVNGSQLRVDVDDGSGDARMAMFSLDGFEEALNRCVALAELIREWDRTDADFFRNVGPKEEFSFRRDVLHE